MSRPVQRRRAGPGRSTLRGYAGRLTIRCLDLVLRRRDVASRLFREIAAWDPAGTVALRAVDPAVDRAAFLAFCAAHRPMSTGQLLQDLWVLYETGLRRDGYFVEFGAGDGCLHSNTLILERQFGWRGLLAEPNPAVTASLVAARRAAIDQRCVWSRSGESVELLVPDDPELATVLAAAVPDGHTATRLASGAPVTVRTVSLRDLLDEYRAPDRIDYMSVDTEGTELEILSSFDFRARRIELLSVEHNHGPAERELDRLMADNGYERRFAELSGWDAWYRIGR